MGLLHAASSRQRRLECSLFRQHRSRWDVLPEGGPGLACRLQVPSTRLRARNTEGSGDVRPPGEGATVRTASWPRPAPGLSGPLCPHQDSGSSACRFPKAALIGRLVLCSFLPPLFSLPL